MGKKLKSCFSQEAVNLGRQPEVDIAKGLAVIFMVFSHAFIMLWDFFDPEVSDALGAIIFDEILGGSFAAPVFMLCMGLGICFSRKNSPKELVRRAGQLTVIAYVLEIFRTLIPGSLEAIFYGEYALIGEYALACLNVDILQFAFMALLLMALLKKLEVKPLVMVGIAAVMSIAGQLLQWVSTGYLATDIVAGYFWLSYGGSYFPLLNWFIFPAAGYALGQLWKHLTDKDRFFRWVTPISWAVTAVYFGSMIVMDYWYYFSGEEYYGIGLLDAIFALVVCFAVLGLGHTIHKHAATLSRLLTGLSRRVTAIYCIHWVILSFVYAALSCFAQDYVAQWLTIPLAVVTVVVSELIGRWYHSRRRKAVTAG